MWAHAWRRSPPDIQAAMAELVREQAESIPREAFAALCPVQAQVGDCAALVEAALVSAAVPRNRCEACQSTAGGENCPLMPYKRPAPIYGFPHFRAGGACSLRG